MVMAALFSSPITSSVVRVYSLPRLKLYGLIVLEALYSYLRTFCIENSRYRKSEFLSYSFNLLVTFFVILVGTV